MLVMKTVLVVDDSSIIRSAVSRVLKDGHYKVLVAEDGKKALEIAGHSKKDIKLIITDIYMPNMDGLEFLKQLKMTAHGKFLPVIMLTTDAQTERVEQARSLGANAFIVKPFSETQLLDAVKRLIR
jgi:two-component system chemotaxis response regulator CheY